MSLLRRPARTKAGTKRFRLLMIKPSHYDDEGYVIQWLRSPIPANSLACLYSLAREIKERRGLGEDVELELLGIDETNTRIQPKKHARWVKDADWGVVMMVGVQSNQYPHALDLTRSFRELGAQVGIGGFHTSGTLSMLPGVQPEVQEAIDLGAFIFAGEAEQERLEGVLKDAMAGALKPIYNYMNDLPSIEGVPPPHLPASVLKRTAGASASFDAGRGCPFQCSFCTIINVQGRKSRFRTPDDIERIVRENAAQGISWFFLTDDNFARNKNWQPIFDRLIALRAEGMKVRLTIQVDTLCHRLPGFIDKAAKAGVTRAFIGLENISPDNLTAAKKKQNHITEYREMLLAWKRAKVVTYCGYILGFPADTPERIRRDVQTIQRELPLDILEFFPLTPLPGSEDHQRLTREGVWMDPDLNKYDLNHVVTTHATMSIAEWEQAYRNAWTTYYTPEHVTTLMRRAAAFDMSPRKVGMMSVWFNGAIQLEGVHPLESGILRRKFRVDRRPGLPIEPVWVFYPRYWTESLVKGARWGARIWRLNREVKALRRDPDRLSYRDASLTLHAEDETDLAMFATDEAKAYVVQERRLKAVRDRAA